MPEQRKTLFAKYTHSVKPMSSVRVLVNYCQMVICNKLFLTDIFRDFFCDITTPTTYFIIAHIIFLLLSVKNAKSRLKTSTQ